MPIEAVFREEIGSFAHRLEEFGLALPPGEEALLRAILMRAAADDGYDVEAHGLAGTTLGALVLAAAGTIGVANSNMGALHHQTPATTHVRHVVSEVGNEKGGSETITYTTPAGTGSR